MPRGERVLCGTAAWGALARRVALPWALGPQPLAGRVLEIGGGTGATAAGLLARCPAAQVTVTDLDPVMVAAAARRLRHHGARARADLADATALPYADASFDAVVSCLMLHHVGNWELAVAEAVRVLRPGGRFVGYDLADTATSRAIHHADGIHDLRSISEPTLRAVLAGLGVPAPALRRGRLGLTLRWTAVTP
jgi:SAM-dependent methyltransferase